MQLIERSGAHRRARKQRWSRAASGRFSSGPAYMTYDAALGITTNNWTAQVQGTNITAVDTPTNVSAGEYLRAETPLRPRVLMAQFAYRF